MVRQRMVAPDTAQEAMARPLGVQRGAFYTKRRESFFFDYVRDQLIKRYGLETVRKGGLKVHTTIDLKLQKVARQAITKALPSRDLPRAALVSIDPKTGHILAMASSMSYADSKFNLAAQGKRQPGSTFKVMEIGRASCRERV